MIKVNEYFEGKIKSLAFEYEGAPYTIGVFLPGEYSVPTEKEEHVTVIVGAFDMRLPDEDWKTVKSGDTVVIPSNITFDLKVTEPASYVCTFK